MTGARQLARSLRGLTLGTVTKTRVFTKLAVTLAVSAGLASLVSACGSGGSGDASQRVAQATTQAQAALATKSQQIDATTSDTATQSHPGSTATQTKTIKPPAPPKAVTKTETSTTPSQSAQITHDSTSVQIAPTSTTADDSSGGVPWWGWLLIALAVGALAIGIVTLGRGRRNADRPGHGEQAADAGPAGPTGRSSI